MRKSKLFFLVTLSLLLLLTLLVSITACSKAETTTPATTAPTQTTPAHKPITLVFSSHDPKEGSWAETYQPFFDAIEKRTNGGIIIEDHWSEELVGMMEAYDACRAGDVDMVHTLPTLYPNYFPMEDVASLTKFDVKCLARSQQATELDSLFPQLAEAYEKSGTKLLFKVGTFPNYSCMTAGNAIHSFADFKGKKYLTTGKWDSEYWKALGMTPVSLMPQESYSALQTGVVDGATLTMPSLFEQPAGGIPADNHGRVRQTSGDPGCDTATHGRRSDTKSHRSVWGCIHYTTIGGTGKV
jgi:TRAP-type C4-dicarboxylate transport system substrate-binding protein